MNPFKGIAVPVLLILGLLAARIAPAKVYIDIDSPSFQKFPIAIADFKPLKAQAEPGDLPVWFADALAKNLTITGYFSVIDRKAFLEDTSRAGITSEGTRFSDWSTIGAEYLIKGGFQTDGRQFTTEFRLFDVLKGEMVVGKKYLGTPDDKGRMVGQFANEVMRALTGEDGLFDTRIAFARKSGSAADIYSVQFDGSNMQRLTQNSSLTLAVRWSPDGSRLAFTSYRDGNPDIYLLELASGRTEKLVSYPGVNLPGAWSRDGLRVLSSLSREGNPDIYDVNVGNRLLNRLTRDYAIDVSPTRSPDEKRIAFVSNRQGSPQIFVMDSDGGNVRRLTLEGNYNTSPAWSPKGGKIAYEGSINGRYQIFVIDANGGAPQQLTFAPFDHESPVWSPDGRYLAYSVKGYGRSRIEIMNANGQNSRILYEGSDSCLSPAWSPHLQ
jgi:TolB protein